MVPLTPVPHPRPIVRRRRRRHVVAIGVGVALLGVLLLRPFDAGAEAPPSAEQALFGAARTPEDRLSRRADLYADLASELGVAPEEVDEAMDAVLDDRLAAQVAAGRLTAEQATEIRAQWDAGELADSIRGRLRERLGAFGDRLPLGGD